MYEYAHPNPGDHAAIEALLDLAFGHDLRGNLRRLDVFVEGTPDGLLKAELRRSRLVGEMLVELRPDHVILWSGNFHYQEGTLAALRDCQLINRTFFAEVAWFPQKDFLYFDPKGVNAFSTLPGEPYPLLQQQQSTRLETWRQRYRMQRLGGLLNGPSPRSVFVPLQVDTDTSILKSSPFKSMEEFIKFLERWIPDECEVTIKLHPKATYPYLPTSRRHRFRVVASGAIEQYIADADTVIGVNSTVLLEAAALGKRVVAFGAGLFSGTNALIEALPDSDAEHVLREPMNEIALNSFLYHLVFERQVSLDALVRHDYIHLASRVPFRDLFELNLNGSQQRFALDSQEGKVMIKIGKSKVAKTACLDVEREGQIIIGDDCEIRHHAVLEVSGRYNGTIEIGNHCVIGIGNWLQGSGRIKIGNDVIIGPYVAIVSTNHSHKDIETPIARQPLQTGEIVIEDDVWIGAHCTIAQNVRIGAHSIIGANSFVNKDVPPYSIVAGAPAKFIKSRK